MNDAEKKERPLWWWLYGPGGAVNTLVGLAVVEDFFIAVLVVVVVVQIATIMTVVVAVV